MASKTPKELATESLVDREHAYASDWQKDAERLNEMGLYTEIANLINPKDDDLIVDIGTGAAYQLIQLVLKNPKATYIGTERNRASTIATYQNLQAMKIEKIFSVLATSELEKTNDGRGFWSSNAEFVRQNMHQVRIVLKDYILLLDDDIRYPEILPIVLDDKKIDVGILSMPGGSMSRIYEWPFEPGQKKLSDAQMQKRVNDVSDMTRIAFYHFMSEYVRESGRIVVAERMHLPASSNFSDAIGIMMMKKMKHLTKYWQSLRGFFIETDLTDMTVKLSATDEDGEVIENNMPMNKESRRGVVVCTLERNEVSFEEDDLPRPIGMSE